ncbi:MAG: hypothetical protein ACRDD6_11695 [Tannerellaceae bacterium]
MYHLWLANGKCSVPFNTEINAEIGKVISDPNFDYFLLTKRVQSAFSKLCLVARSKAFAFVFEGENKKAYTKGIVHGVHDVSKSNKFVRKSNKNVLKHDRFVAKPNKDVTFCAQNKPEKKEVLVIETPMHENFING